jgi:hypothetical protein
MTSFGNLSTWNCTGNCYFTNSQPDVWEEKSAILVVPQGFAIAYLHFQTDGGPSAGIDDVSIVADTLAPQVSPTNAVLTATPTSCKLEWDTPNGPVDSVVIRYGNRTHPLTGNEGSQFGTVPAQPGTRQQITVEPFNWNSDSNYLYFSVFAVNGGVDSPPDLAVVKLKPDKLLVDVVIQEDLSVKFSWRNSFATNDVSTYAYAVGASPSGKEVVYWTDTLENSVTLSSLPRGTPLYFTAKVKSLCGKWSDASTVSATVGAVSGIAAALGSPDNSRVTVTGIVSAVYIDRYYLQSPERTAGIRVSGNTSAWVGDEVTVSGIMATANGERTINPGD